MLDMEKVIKDLEFCVNGHFKVELSLATKILALLKEHEHKDRMYHALEDDWKRLNELLKEQEAKTGKWIEQTDCLGDTYYDCSVCNESWITIEGTPWVNGMNYCPHCGAKMEFEGR